MPLMALIAGCSGGSQPATRQIDLNENVVVQLQETVEIRNEATTVRLESVAEDSRCPANAECVQAGQLRIAIKVAGYRGTYAQESKLPILPTELPAPAASGYQVTLIDAPLPGESRTSPLPSWPVTIRVSKVASP